MMPSARRYFFVRFCVGFCGCVCVKIFEFFKFCAIVDIVGRVFKKKKISRIVAR